MAMLMPMVSKNVEFPELARASRGAVSKAPSNPKTVKMVPSDWGRLRLTTLQTILRLTNPA
jgi:hypothetical protein